MDKYEVGDEVIFVHNRVIKSGIIIGKDSVHEKYRIENIIEWVAESDIERKIIMEFEKKDLIAGKHVVKDKDGVLKLVMHEGLYTKRGYHSSIAQYNDDLTYKVLGRMNIDEVFEIMDESGFVQSVLKRESFDSKYIKSIWKRKEKKSVSIAGVDFKLWDHEIQAIIERLTKVLEG